MTSVVVQGHICECMWLKYIYTLINCVHDPVHHDLETTGLSYVYVQAEAVLEEFLKEREPEANSILCMDNKLTENEKQFNSKFILGFLKHRM